MPSYRPNRGADLPGYWKGRRVLVTGHTGFKGAWLCELLLHLGARVSGYALVPPTQPNLHDLLDLSADVESRINDIRDESAVAGWIASVKPEYIFHLAAQSLVRAGYERPVETFATNVLGTAHLLEAARSTPSVRGVVVVTSDKCYRNREWIWGYREDEPLGGEDPYSSSKAAAELVTHAYAASYGSSELRIASARAGNVIGGGDWSSDRLVPDIIRSVAAGRPLVLRFPNAVRPWQHVLEPLVGYLMLAMSLDRGDSGAWNFGPDGSAHVTVRELATAIFEGLGKPARIEVDGDERPHEAAQLRLDSTKAHELLGWRGKLDLDMTVAWTSVWYKAQLSGGDVRATTLAQIGEYLQQ
ncbi:MAG TPA: CDP-glucose 4,6-dehydratase [Candidatus Acidoferrum sp.]|nr:CDP-glucose 4,6-dehydratase [Candidatus Acidoferrum sp.]